MSCKPPTTGPREILTLMKIGSVVAETYELLINNRYNNYAWTTKTMTPYTV
jgi:hypothetical protein